MNLQCTFTPRSLAAQIQLKKEEVKGVKTPKGSSSKPEKQLRLDTPTKQRTGGKTEKVRRSSISEVHTIDLSPKVSKVVQRPQTPQNLGRTPTSNNNKPVNLSSFSTASAGLTSKAQPTKTKTSSFSSTKQNIMEKGYNNLKQHIRDRIKSETVESPKTETSYLEEINNDEYSLFDNVKNFANNGDLTLSKESSYGSASKKSKSTERTGMLSMKRNFSEKVFQKAKDKCVGSQTPKRSSLKMNLNFKNRAMTPTVTSSHTFSSALNSFKMQFDDEDGDDQELGSARKKGKNKTCLSTGDENERENDKVDQKILRLGEIDEDGNVTPAKSDSSINSFRTANSKVPGRLESLDAQNQVAELLKEKEEDKKTIIFLQGQIKNIKFFLESFEQKESVKEKCQDKDFASLIDEIKKLTTDLPGKAGDFQHTEYEVMKVKYDTLALTNDILKNENQMLKITQKQGLQYKEAAKKYRELYKFKEEECHIMINKIDGLQKELNLLKNMDKNNTLIPSDLSPVPERQDKKKFIFEALVPPKSNSITTAGSEKEFHGSSGTGISRDERAVLEAYEYKIDMITKLLPHISQINGQKKD